MDVSVSIEDKLKNKLSFINQRAMVLIDELHKHLKILPVHDEQYQERQICIKLLDKLIDSIVDKSLAAENTIYDVQIDILLQQTKVRLEKIREEFLTSALNVETFNLLFKELTGCVEDSHRIMSTIFKYISKKTDDLSEAKQILSIQIDDMKKTNDQVLDDNRFIRKELEQLKEEELKRKKKERYFERQVVIRDLFVIPLDRLSQELKSNNISETQVGIFSRSTIDINKLSDDYPVLFSILKKIANEFEIDPINMLNYIQQKKHANTCFHINADMKTYANEHANYDLNEFLENLNMHSFDREEYFLLQPVFSNICRKIKHDH